VDWRALRSPDWQTRKEAVSRLAVCGCQADGEVSPEVLSALHSTLKDSHWAVRQRGALVLRELSQTAEHVTRLREACVMDEQVQEVWPSRSTMPAFPQLSLGKAAKQTFENLNRCCAMSMERTASYEKKVSVCTPRSSGDECEPVPESSVECVDGIDVGEISMHLLRSAGTKFGIKVDADCNGLLKVLSVNPGIIDDWNQAQPPWRQLRPGDCVTAVNGMRGDPKSLIRALMSDDGDSFELTFERMRLDMETQAGAAAECSEGDDDCATIHTQISAFQPMNLADDANCCAELLLAAGGTDDQDLGAGTVQAAFVEGSETSHQSVTWNCERLVEKLNKRARKLSMEIVPMRESL